MVILIQKRKLLVFCGIFVGILALLGAFRQGGEIYRLASAEAEMNPTVPVTVILDAGHGGPDGGASSPDGVQESGINLSVAFRVRDLLAFSGQGSVMTRTEDVSVHTPGARRWKASDLQNRVALVNETENAVLLSIHQNSLPSSPVTHGAQVFYNRTGEALSAHIQTVLNEAVNPGNEKQAKPAPEGVYLMKHIQGPGILIECGFLSNPEETLRLQEPSHQIKLAAAITAGFLLGLEEELL